MKSCVFLRINVFSLQKISEENMNERNLKMKLGNTQIEKFRQYLIEEERSKNTIEKYERDIRYFLTWLDGKTIDKTRVVEYKNELCLKFSPRSVNSMLSSLNSFLLFLQRPELKAKTLKIQRQIFADDDRELSKGEYERLLSAAKSQNNDRLYYLMQTIGSTGIRISELSYITVNAVRTGKAHINCKGKLRQVFLPKSLCKMLSEYIKSQRIKDGSVFVTRTGIPLNRSNVWKMLKDLCKIAGVAPKKVFPHNFRHLFARTFYALQRDIVRLADVLGHSNVNTTRIYTAETGISHLKQIEMLGLLRC